MVAILHNIRSIYNVGSIFRTSDAAGIEKIYLCGFTPVPINRFGDMRQQFLKTSLGAESNVLWEYKKSTVRIINFLKKKGFLILAVEQDSKSINYIDAIKIIRKSGHKNLDKVAVVVGNEIEGLNKKILDKCDKIIEIPMFGIKKSLNVAVAFGVVVVYITSKLKRNKLAKYKNLNSIKSVHEK